METGDRKLETGEWKQETGDRRMETGEWIRWFLEGSVSVA